MELAVTELSQVTYLPVDATGRVEPDAVRTALRDDTCLVTIMHANNETGSINDIAAIARVAHQRGVLFHTDASQSLGKVEVDVNSMDVDLLTIAGHKLYCPAGVGALYVRQGCVLPKFMHGAGHEAGRRAGTENTMHLVALGEACRLCQENSAAHQLHLKTMRDLLHSLLLEKLPALRLNGHPDDRLPNTLNVSLPPECGTSHQLIAAVSDEVAFSAGSACHAADVCHVSHVLAAMGHDHERGSRAIRLSVGRFTSEDDVRRAARVITTALGK
jgi:cysteine desulfurase